MTILIKNGDCFNSAGKLESGTEILLTNGLISDIGKNLEQSNTIDEILDARGLLVFPGLVDMHVHLRDPGFTHKETLTTGSSSAVKGGFTTICCMPNTNPVIDSEKIVDDIISRSKEVSCNIVPIGSITQGMLGEMVAPIYPMYNQGVRAISEDGKSVLNTKVLSEAMKICKDLNISMLSHCEDLSLVDYSAESISNISEYLIVARDIMLADSIGADIHICHVSTKESVEIIREAKKRGIRVTAECTPHHFSLDEMYIDLFGTNAKMAPPLRSKKDVEAVVEGLRDGTIDVIATDHAPHSIEEKSTEFIKAPNGIIGLETAVSLSITNLVKTGVLTFEDLMVKLSYNPSKIMRLFDKGDIKVGNKADITIINPNIKYTVNIDEFQSKSRNCPYNGMQLEGIVKYTIVDGKIVYSC